MRAEIFRKRTQVELNPGFDSPREVFKAQFMHS